MVVARVDADGGGVHRRETLAQHLHARTVLAADHRARDGGAEEARLHAGLARQGLAQGRCLALLQLRSAQDRGGLDQVAVGAFQRVGFDHHRIEFARMLLGVLAGVGVGPQGGQDHQ